MKCLMWNGEWRMWNVKRESWKRAVKRDFGFGIWELGIWNWE